MNDKTLRLKRIRNETERNPAIHWVELMGFGGGDILSHNSAAEVHSAHRYATGSNLAFYTLMKAHEIPKKDRICLNCRYCMLWDSTCALPEHDFKPISYDDPPCEHFETEELYSPSNGDEV